MSKPEEQRIQKIMVQQKQAELIFQMRDSAYLRTLILHRMALQEDPADALRGACLISEISNRIEGLGIKKNDVGIRAGLDHAILAGTAGE